MKTFKEFNIESRQYLDELAFVPALALAGKAIGTGLSLYSAGSAVNNLRKGKFKQAGMDALGIIPGSKAFKAAKAVGATKNLARAASTAQSINRYNMTGLTPNAYAKATDATFDKGVELAGKGINLVRGKKNKKVTTSTPETPSNNTPSNTPNNTGPKFSKKEYGTSSKVPTAKL